MPIVAPHHRNPSVTVSYTLGPNHKQGGRETPTTVERNTRKIYCFFKNQHALAPAQGRMNSEAIVLESRWFTNDLPKRASLVLSLLQ